MKKIIAIMISFSVPFLLFYFFKNLISSGMMILIFLIFPLLLSAIKKLLVIKRAIKLDGRYFIVESIDWFCASSIFLYAISIFFNHK